MARDASGHDKALSSSPSPSSGDLTILVLEKDASGL
jgi:hypothetical protein